MRFSEAKLPGVFEIHLEPHADDRGFFARSWCQREFETHGLNPRLAQCNISYNLRKGRFEACTYQASALRGSQAWCAARRERIYDVVLIFVPNRRAYKSWIAVVLTAANRNMVYVPEGCAHGFLTLEDETEVLYQMSEFYHAELSAELRWNDPAFEIDLAGKS